ncbi:uncharacterized protein [Lolium perenne]|uniref:uncharacterized protein isoform X1 n=1 Tax=Lolium perenne TaxID=4522 RepID=UPI0021F531CD|nr:zinc finger CCCH domain-containing protein 62-like [Lolium perenne]
MPVTRGRAAAAAAVVVEEESDAPIDISSDSDAESADSGSEEEEEPSSDEDYIDISDSGESYVDISDSGDDDDGERSCDGNEGEAEAGPPGADRSEDASTKIADLLRRGRNLERIKLVECKAYLKKNGLSQVGDMTTCVERIMLHWRFKTEDPEKIYPRSSFSINCKGDVCRGDAVLFKQKVHEKSGKRHSKCIGKRIVAGKVIKESYGKEKQQHTFTIQVFWSKGVGKLPPLNLLLVKGRNLYRMMTFRQSWTNEEDRSKALEEKHGRGDAARRVRALNRPNSGGHVLKGKKSKEKEKHMSQLGRPDGGSRRTKGKKRTMQSCNSDLPTKKSRKEEHRVSSATVCNGLNSTEVRVSKRKAGSKQKNTVGNNHAQFEGRRFGSASHSQTHPGNSVGINQPLFERPQRPPPLREVGNAWQPRMDGRSIACPNPSMAFEHPNAAPAGWRPPPSNQPGVVFPPFNMSRTMYQSHSDRAYVMSQYKYSGGSNRFPR